MTWSELLATMPLVAILRGLTPEEAEPVGAALVEAGFRCLEVPLNSPRPLESIAILQKRFGGVALVGAGHRAERRRRGRRDRRRRRDRLLA